VDHAAPISIVNYTDASNSDKWPFVHGHSLVLWPPWPFKLASGHSMCPLNTRRLGAINCLIAVHRRTPLHTIVTRKGQMVPPLLLCHIPTPLELAENSFSCRVHGKLFQKCLTRGIRGPNGELLTGLAESSPEYDKRARCHKFKLATFISAYGCSCCECP